MNWRLWIAAFLHGFIFVLILWWMIFAVSLIDRLEPTMIRHRQMLLWEGGTLLFLVGITGSLTVYLFLQEERRTKKLKEFLSGFTHDLKTSLARVRLQTESLRADNRDSSQSEMFNRLMTDTSRLETQVQNSLFVGATRQSALYPETYSLLSLVDILKDSWPQLEIACKFDDGRDARLQVDKRAIESVFSNLIHNSIIHGQASRVSIDVKKANVKGRESESVTMQVHDNGRGFQGDGKRLGQMFFRHNPSSGSGLGLFTVKSYVERMRGQIKFQTSKSGQGFVVELTLPGQIERL